MDRITVTVNNWKKWNPRKDYRKPTWFAMSNNLLDDPDFASFTPLEFHALVYIFCQASQRNSETFDIVFAHAKQRNIPERLLQNTIGKLQQSRILAKSVQNPNGSVQDLPSRGQNPNSTERQRDRETERHELFDFEEIYQAFPRKRGKADGIRRLRDRVKTREQFDEFFRSVRQYASECKRLRTDEKYVMFFSTFVGTSDREPWRDFLTTPVAQPKPQAPIEPEEASEPMSPEQLAELKARVAKIGRPIPNPNGGKIT